MQGTRSNIARNKQLIAKDVSERALLLSIENVDLDADTIKALRLTCKRIKVAADAKVKKFALTLDQEPGDVQRSGLLKNIKKLWIRVNTYARGASLSWSHCPGLLSRCRGLLSLAVEICSMSLEYLYVDLVADSETSHSCVKILGTATWESLKQLDLPNRPETSKSANMPSLLAVFLANPGTLPALETLYCKPGTDDLESLQNSPVIGNLKDLFFPYWGDYSAPSTISARVTAAMRSLVQKATNLKTLMLESSTFDFFDSEHLVSLESLELDTPLLSLEEGSVSVAPVLARPWLKLHSLSIKYEVPNINRATLQGPDLVRIFEAEDTLPVLKNLRIVGANFAADALTCVRRPHLEEFHLIRCGNGHKLISKLAQLMKDDRNALANLKEFLFDCRDEVSGSLARKSISEFLSCPQMAALETLAIGSLGRQEAEILSSDTEKYCPSLKHLHLS